MLLSSKYELQDLSKLKIIVLKNITLRYHCYNIYKISFDTTFIIIRNAKYYIFNNIYLMLIMEDILDKMGISGQFAGHEFNGNM